MMAFSTTAGSSTRSTLLSPLGRTLQATEPQRARCAMLSVKLRAASVGRQSRPNQLFKPTPSHGSTQALGLMRYIIAVVVLMLASSDASARKCGARFFEISGTVTDIGG